MEEELEWCVNCCQSIDSKTDGSESGMDSADISSSLTSIYKLNYLKVFADSPRHSSPSTFSSSNSCAKNIDGNLCSDCLSVFIDLWKFYEEFNHLRTVDSILEEEIQALDNHIKAYEISRRVQKKPESPLDELVEETEEQDDQAYDVYSDNSIEDVSSSDEEEEEEQARAPANSVQNKSNLSSSSSPSSDLNPIVLGGGNRKRKTTSVPQNSVTMDKIRKIDIDGSNKPATKRNPIPAIIKETQKKLPEHPQLKPNETLNKKNPVVITTPGQSQIIPGKIEMQSSTIEKSKTVHEDESNFSPPNMEESADSDFDPQDLSEHGKSDSDDEWTTSPKPEMHKSNSTPALKQKQKVNQDDIGDALEKNSVGDPARQEQRKKMRERRSFLKNYRIRKIKCPNPCWHCEMDFEDPDELYHHAYRTHFKKGNSICERCCLVSEHSQTHTAHVKVCGTMNPGELYPMDKCEECETEFLSKKDLKFHMSTKHGDKIFTCSYPGCKYQTAYRYTMKLHAKQVHRSHEVPVEKRTCPECNKVFKGEHVLKSHLRYRHSEEGALKYKESKNKYKVRINERRRQKAPKRTTICTDCGGLDLFTYRGYINHRKDFHRDIRFSSFVCEQCGKCFTHRGSLNSHMEKVHPDGSKSVICDACGKVFTSEAYLQIHYKRVHTEEGRLRYSQGLKRTYHRRKLRTKALAQYLKNGVQGSQAGTNGGQPVVASTSTTSPDHQSSS